MCNLLDKHFLFILFFYRGEQTFFVELQASGIKLLSLCIWMTTNFLPKADRNILRIACWVQSNQLGYSKAKRSLDEANIISLLKIAVRTVVTIISPRISVVIPTSTSIKTRRKKKKKERRLPEPCLRNWRIQIYWLC